MFVWVDKKKIKRTLINIFMYLIWKRWMGKIVFIFGLYFGDNIITFFFGVLFGI